MRQAETLTNDADVLARALSVAEQELGSFCAAVNVVFGTDYVQEAIHFWIGEIESPSWALTDEHLDFRPVTVAAIGRLITRLNAR